ncbi:uncharacterized protein [Littorina saxatilis]|uniref:uncharacterized protein n=1 Tax=Littorina saxatilis TaxID=31220 RepID=UPI0038B53C04
MIFCGKKANYQFPFKFQNQKLDHVSSFKYLGLTFNFNGNFKVGIKLLKDQARKAMMSLLRKSRQLDLPIKTQLELFQTLVTPILTYSCEVWGYTGIEIIETLQLEFCKYLLHLKKSTPNCMVYGETGQYPLYIYWTKACNECSKADNYSLFKMNFHYESYLDKLPNCYKIALTKFRTSNHKLPIEKGRYTNLPKYERVCTKCNLNRVGDEFHFLLECPALAEIREKFIPPHFRQHPNFFKYSNLMTTPNRKKLLNLGKFVAEGFKLYK